MGHLLSVELGSLKLLADTGEHSAPVTHWLGRILLTLLMLAILTGVYWLMFRGWRKRAARQADLPAPASTRPGTGRLAADQIQSNQQQANQQQANQQTADPAASGGAQSELPDPARAVEGVYASTTSSGNWLDRIVAHGLGVRSNAWVQVEPDGVFIAREAAPDLFIPVTDLCGAALAPGIAGKVTGGEGVLLITWRLGDRQLDTGFHPRAKQDRARLLDEINALAKEGELA